MGGVERDRVERLGLLADRLVPGDVEAVVPRDLVAEPAEHEHALDRRRQLARLIGDALHVDFLAGPRKAVRGDEHPSLGIDQPRRQRVGAEAGEDRHRDRAELRAGVVRGDRLGRHRHEQADRVTGLDAQALQRPGDGVGQRAQLRPGQLAALTALALPGQGPLRPAALDPAIEAMMRQVDPAVHEPAHPLPALGVVEGLAVGNLELQAQVVDHRVPEGGRVLEREGAQVVRRLDSELSHQPRDVRVGHPLGVRAPEVLGILCDARDAHCSGTKAIASISMAAPSISPAHWTTELPGG